jgi:hypothetical protein
MQNQRAITNVTPGTAKALRAVVLDANKTIDALTVTTLTATNPIVNSGGQGALTGQTIAANLVHTGGTPATTTTPGSNQTPVATEVYFAQVFIPANMTVTGVSYFVGTVASGNVKVGLCDSTGAVVATSASTAVSGTAGYQRVAFTGTYAALGPGTYYVVTFFDNNTVRPCAHAVGDFRAGKQTGQTFSTGFTTITPGTTFTTNLGPIASLY